jgi:DNA-binding GntR family transcriptional regulator
MSTEEAFGRARERPGDTVQQLTDRLRDLILEGHYQPGQRLSQGDMAAELTVGRTPLREAVRMLEAEGLLDSTANRGVTVKRVSLESVEDLYAIRLLVEPPLAAALLDRYNEADIARMHEHLTAMIELRDRYRDFQRIHRDFHQVQLEYYGSEARRLVDQIHQRVFWHQRAYMSRPRVPEDFIDVDRLILEATERRDPDLMRQLTQFHLIDAAIGLILDVEPDHRFDPLLVAATGVGISIATDREQQIRRPTEIAWAGESVLPADLSTTNLRLAPKHPASPR